jgi:ribosomal-protein-alanine N-acetyltransferase
VTAPIIETDRLILRNWTDADAAPLAAINSDPRVMEFFPEPWSGDQSDAFLDRARAAIAERGYGIFALEEKASSRLIGFAGLAPVGFTAQFTPATHISWRLARRAWGSGYATEAASAAVADGFSQHALKEIVAFTPEWNTRSRRVMEKIGMHRDPDGDFIHPGVPPGHKLAHHVLYRIARPAA